MQVFVIPPDKVEQWVNETFNPVLDTNGNYVVAVNADYSMHSFNEELQECEIVDYVPLQNSIE